MRFLSVFFFVVAIQIASAQKVGVVLSGGGAKGIAHVGVLKALEENNVPIDYLAGTSMGGIVAGSYAAGLSPEQIEEIMLSEEFQRWINGKMEQEFNYYYNKHENNPSFITIRLSVDSTLNFILSTTLANDLSLNFALAEKMAIPNAIARKNFDSLFIPLRVVAADIFTQSVKTLSKGELSDALRATHTAPFFYQPIKVEGKYLFDGGVYNNFPVDIMQEEFAPDVIIGCNVSSKVYDEYPYKEADELVSKSLLLMLLDKSDPGKVPPTGVYLQPNLSGFSSLDFAKARQLIDSGYKATLRQMPELKSKIKKTRDRSVVQSRRNNFIGRSPGFIIDRIEFDGFNSRQQKYITRFFGRKKEFFSPDEIKSSFYQLVAEDYFKNIYPGFRYDSATENFRFLISRRPQNNLQVEFGGIIASRSISNIFLGVNFYFFNRELTHSNLNLYAGSFYKSAQLKIRRDYPVLGRMHLEAEGTYNEWNFFENNELVVFHSTPTILDRIDRKAGLAVGWPLGKQYKLSLAGSYLNNLDRFSNFEVLNSTDTLDQLRISGFRSGISITTNTLNRKQYPSLGKNFSLQFDAFSVMETLLPGSTSVFSTFQREHRAWQRLHFTAEQYFKKGFYSTGYLFETVVSNQPLFFSYFASLINSPGFSPLQDSRTFLLQKLRAHNFLAFGLRNVFTLKPSLDLRFETYLFKPVDAIIPGPNQRADITRDITRIFFTGMASLVLHSSIGPVSLSFNYYDDKENQFGVLLHAGFLLFNKTSLD